MHAERNSVRLRDTVSTFILNTSVLLPSCSRPRYPCLLLSSSASQPGSFFERALRKKMRVSRARDRLLDRETLLRKCVVLNNSGGDSQSIAVYPLPRVAYTHAMCHCPPTSGRGSYRRVFALLSFFSTSLNVRLYCGASAITVCVSHIMPLLLPSLAEHPVVVIQVVRRSSRNLRKIGGVRARG